MALPTASEMRPRRAAYFALALSICALAALPLQASAIGPSISLSAGPPSVTGTPSPGRPGEANFTGVVDLFTNPVAPAFIVVSITSALGWPITPDGYSWRVTESGRFPFNFTANVPPEATAGVADSIEVTASYQIAGVEAQAESVTVHAEAGPYYGGAVRRVTPPAPMEAGKGYTVEFEVRNEGNARATYSFELTDGALMDKIRGTFVLPDGPALAGQGNASAEFRITPGATSPGGKYQVPVRMDIRDRHGQIQGTANFTLDIEISNLAIYQGILPNWDLRGAYTMSVFGMILLGLWFALHFLLALRRARRDESPFFGELKEGLGRTLLVRGIGRVWARVPRGRPRRAKRPDEVAGAARARAERGR